MMEPHKLKTADENKPDCCLQSDRPCKTSGLHRGVDEDFTFLVCYAAYTGSCLPQKTTSVR
jgi:hypothetical protein